jgi:uncharacterized protein (TIGR00369 family)
VELFSRAKIRDTFGMVLSFNEKGNAVFDLPFNPNLCHALGDVHGGAISTLIDNAGWFSVAPYYETWVSTTDLHVQLLEPAKKEALQAIGYTLRIGNRLAAARMEVRSKSGRLVAAGQGTFTVTSVPYKRPEK